jgi:methylenetetrahydrofolate--tRNA-(uracil-5-)-methyltransferase
MSDVITIIGGGLAGTEAAWQIAQRGVRVRLWEMRPRKMTPAHTSGDLAELVCSNSLGADDVTKAPGLLKSEMRALDSLIITSAAEATVPAGAALAVDREVFAKVVTAKIEAHPLIEVIRDECVAIPADGIVVVASGPLTSDALAADIARYSGSSHLYFWDAIAPIVTLESVDFAQAFRASRYNKSLDLGKRNASAPAPTTDASTDASATESAPEQPEELGDYINCPMTKPEYYAFVDALLAAEMATLRDFEQANFFEGCLPVEVMARRGRDALAFGPMRPVGLRDPRTGRRPFAVVQLRQDNIAGTLYNLVGFQTNLKFPEQDRVLRMIPGLGQAEFVRFGQMHRNTFINSPTLLEPSLRFRTRPTLYFAGQIVGVEGYAGNAATGLLAGINAVRTLRGESLLTLPPTTMLGALCHYVTHAEAKHFQPMKANFGIFPALENPPRDKRRRAELYSERAQHDLATYLAQAQHAPLDAKLA